MLGQCTDAVLMQYDETLHELPPPASQRSLVSIAINLLHALGDVYRYQLPDVGASEAPRAECACPLGLLPADATHRLRAACPGLPTFLLQPSVLLGKSWMRSGMPAPAFASLLSYAMANGLRPEAGASHYKIAVAVQAAGFAPLHLFRLLRAATTQAPTSNREACVGDITLLYSSIVSEARVVAQSPLISRLSSMMYRLLANDSYLTCATTTSVAAHAAVSARKRARTAGTLSGGTVVASPTTTVQVLSSSVATRLLAASARSGAGSSDAAGGSVSELHRLLAAPIVRCRALAHAWLLHRTLSVAGQLTLMVDVDATPRIMSGVARDMRAAAKVQAALLHASIADTRSRAAGGLPDRLLCPHWLLRGLVCLTCVHWDAEEALTAATTSKAAAAAAAASASSFVTTRAHARAAYALLAVLRFGAALLVVARRLLRAGAACSIDSEAAAVGRASAHSKHTVPINSSDDDAVDEGACAARRVPAAFRGDAGGASEEEGGEEEEAVEGDDEECAAEM
ncbi:MAG: hypothetical protein EOO41_03405, partial [Methanobacteriota archaeon]